MSCCDIVSHTVLYDIMVCCIALYYNIASYIVSRYIASHTMSHWISMYLKMGVNIKMSGRELNVNACVDVLLCCVMLD